MADREVMVRVAWFFSALLFSILVWIAVIYGIYRLATA